MPELFFTGPAGRIEARVHFQINESAPVALIMHPNPKQGGTMNNKVVYAMYTTFVDKGFSTIRFNFRGVGKSEGSYDGGEGELNDAAATLDWLQSNFPSASDFFVAGFSFGSWISMQLLMRRPEISGFVAVSPPANLYDFNFLTPCAVSGKVIQGTSDTIVNQKSVDNLVQKLSNQKGMSIDYSLINGADHFFNGYLDKLKLKIGDFLEKQFSKKQKMTG